MTSINRIICFGEGCTKKEWDIARFPGQSRFEGPRRNWYKDWREDGVPSYPCRPLPVDLREIPPAYQRDVRERCLERYKQCSEIHDQAIGDAALRYVYREGDSALGRGPLSRLAERFSSRVMDLYEMWVMHEKEQGIPMLPLDAGTLKGQGFISTEILRMQESCSGLMEILQELRERLPREEYERFFLELTSAEGRAKGSENLLCREAIRRVEALPEKGLIDRACFMMTKFSDMNREEIECQLDAIARMKPNPDASLEERMLMEIRHRVACDGVSEFVSPGSLGSNPMAYWNIVRRGCPKNPTAEFRCRTYFLYMNNHFINACMQDPRFIEFANQRLKGWRIDPEFVQAMFERDPQFLPPVFRYGKHARINWKIREKRYDPTFYDRHPRPELRAVIYDRAPLNASFRHPLSDTELLAAAGDFNPQALDLSKQVPFSSGGAIYRMLPREQIDDTPDGNAGKQYLSTCKELNLPVIASISGTYDQMATMAGFVGFRSFSDLNDLKLAMIAFMVPFRDHSVQEICFSARSYGQIFYPGPEMDWSIYTGARFVSLVKEELQRRGTPHPSYYLTAEYAQEVVRKIQGETSNG